MPLRLPITVVVVVVVVAAAAAAASSSDRIRGTVSIPQMGRKGRRG